MYIYPVKLILVTVRKKVLDQGFQEAAAGGPYMTHHRGGGGSAAALESQVLNDERKKTGEPLERHHWPPSVAALLALSQISRGESSHHHTALPAAHNFLALRVAAARPLAKMIIKKRE